MAVLTFLVLLACATFLVTKSEAQKPCPHFNFSRHVNWRLQCGIFNTLAANAIDCQKQCTATLNCFSVNTYRSNNGTEICELVRGTKDSFEREKCFVKKSGDEHSELLNTDYCSSSLVHYCHEAQARKALSDDWYQLGSSAFKHFKTKKTWKDANDTCSANNAFLATIDSELENRFITEVFLKTIKDITETAVKYWKLDGSEKDVGLYNSASFKKVQPDEPAVLFLPGTAGSYASTPAVAIQSTSFTIALWLKLYSIPTSSYYFYSYWFDPYIFHLGAVKKSYKIVIEFAARKKSNPGTDLFLSQGGNIVVNTWTHIVGTWDRATKQATIYQDGTQVAQVTSAYNDLDLPNPDRPFYDIGLKRDGATLTYGAMSKLAVFNRSLIIQEVNVLKDTTAIFGLAKSLEAWVGSTNSYVNWAPVLQSNSTCVVVRAWEPYQQDKVPCDEIKEFICESLLD